MTGLLAASVLAASVLAASVDVGSACLPPEGTPAKEDARYRSEGTPCHKKRPVPEASLQRSQTQKYNRGLSRQPRGGTMAAQSNVAECCRADTSIACLSNTTPSADSDYCLMMPTDPF